jgi:hypothetical protein
MDKDYKNKLKSRMLTYGSMATAIGAASNVNAAVIYTDVTPDFTGGAGSGYNLDVNNDAINDFSFNGWMGYYGAYGSLYMNGIGSNSWVAPYSGGDPSILSSSNMVSAGQSFGGGFGSFFWSSYGYCYGNWCGGQTDKYIGLRFNIGGNTHYGWVRVDIGPGFTFTIKDYAYEDTPNTPIMAGDVGVPAASTALNVIGMDIADNNNGLDLEVSFDAGVDETTIDEYRILVVKAANAGGFDTTLAKAVPMANYTMVTPNASPTYTQALGAGANDVDGDPIENFVDYHVFVLSMADGVNATHVSLSQPSPMVTLYAPLDPATNVMGMDIDENSNGSDVQVTWDAIANEGGLQEYRVLIVKAANAGSFDLTAANGAVAGVYMPQTPQGLSNYSLNLVSFSNDVDGDPITIATDYVAFVMTKSTNPLIGDNLSAGSPTFMLTTTANVAMNVVGQDAGNNQNGTDARVDFNAAADETTVLEYRSIVVKTASAGSFDLAAAQALPSTAYKVVTPTGAPNYAETLDATTTDSDGDPIADNVDYTAFVWSVQNGTTSNADDLSAPSASFMLTTALSIEEGGLEGVNSFFSNGQLIVDAGANQNLSFTLFDLSGKVILDNQLNMNVNKFDVNQLSTGLYLVRLSDGNGNTFTKKIVLQ